jgi:hypothetical protein
MYQNRYKGVFWWVQTDSDGAGTGGTGGSLSVCLRNPSLSVCLIASGIHAIASSPLSTSREMTR